MRHKPLVSVLIPAYNAEPWIAQAIESAKSQTWPRVEILVVDDGSTDRTYEIACRYRGASTTVLTRSHEGAASARNHAFSLCSGEFVQWLDADDILAPDKIALQMHALGDFSRTTLLLSSAWAHFMFSTRRARFIRSPLWADLSPVEWMLLKMEHNGYMQPATWLVSRDLTLAAGPWDTRLLVDDDGEYFCRVLRASQGTRFVGDARVYYRMTGSGSLSHIGRSKQKLAAQLLSCKLHVTYLRELDQSSRSRAACLKYLQIYMDLFYGSTDFADALQQIATQAGGRLYPPTVQKKYAWLQATVGWEAATAIIRQYNELKWFLKRKCDQALYMLES